VHHFLMRQALRGKLRDTNMSRVAKYPVEIPKGVEFNQSGSTVTMKGSKGSLSLVLNSEIELSHEGNKLTVKRRSHSQFAGAMSGTTRALLANMVKGVMQGFEKKLELVGVGYRAQAQGNKLNLTLGFSHPLVYELPKGITVETPSQTEIVIRGADKQAVGQVAAEIRRFRKPEPYKGKGVRYTDEHVVIKEAKKK
jgi:large subunit ribosomal protein L6